jgi:hypothetical protein
MRRVELRLQVGNLVLELQPLRLRLGFKLCLSQSTHTFKRVAYCEKSFSKLAQVMLDQESHWHCTKYCAVHALALATNLPWTK